MRENEVVVNIVSGILDQYPDLDKSIIRTTVERVIYEYEVQPKTREIAVISDMKNNIMMYLATKKLDGLSDKTLKNYALHLNRFANYIQKNTKDVTTLDIRMFLADLLKYNDLKNSSLENEKSILKSFFSWLEYEEYIQKNPTKQIKPTKIEKRIRQALTKQELELLRNGAKTLRQRALLEVAYSTGLRLSEICNIKISDINWQQLSIKVIGKGDKERVVFLNAVAQVHLQRYLKSREDECEYLFTTLRKPFRKVGVRATQREIDKIQEQSELNKNVHIHLLRHTSASHWLNSGMDITVVQDLLGHSSLDTTLIYSKISNTEVLHQHNKFS